ncbi:MAG: 3-oxoacyl-ACP reductase FabG [Myxococcales bacterium]|nr:3-oxoacyl-ACP reductase FabG [Myxococcales bacterium]
MDLELKGRVCLITGGSRGIGRAIAHQLASEGADVTLTYSSNRDAAERVVREIVETYDTQAQAIGFDVKDPSACKSAVDTLVKDKGGLHILVNNAGVAIDNLIMRFKDTDLETIFRTNVFGPFALVRAAVRPMTKARWGRIVNLGSVVGEMGNTGQSAYAATKAALDGLSKSIAKEFGSRNITCNVVAPGFISTDMTADISEEMRAKMVDAIPLGDMGTPEDIANAVAFLCSNRAKYITGHVLNVNGGMYM